MCEQGEGLGGFSHAQWPVLKNTVEPAVKNIGDPFDDCELIVAAGNTTGANM
jgi:hypothetical protein